MLMQTGLVLVRFAADWALVWVSLLFVLLHVLVQVWTTAELLATYCALVGTLTSVDSLVPNQIAHLRKGSVANITLVWLTLIMNGSLVLLQWRELCKSHVAGGTLVWLFTRVGSHVLFQCLSAAKSLGAALLGALELILLTSCAWNWGVIMSRLSWPLFCPFTTL